MEVSGRQQIHQRRSRRAPTADTARDSGPGRAGPPRPGPMFHSATMFNSDVQHPERAARRAADAGRPRSAAGTTRRPRRPSASNPGNVSRPVVVPLPVRPGQTRRRASRTGPRSPAGPPRRGRPGRSAPIRTYVTTGAVARHRPPKTVRACRTERCPSFTHSGHWWPTAASRMQSGQMYALAAGAADIRLLLRMAVAGGDGGLG